MLRTYATSQRLFYKSEVFSAYLSLRTSREAHAGRIAWFEFRDIWTPSLLGLCRTKGKSVPIR